MYGTYQDLIKKYVNRKTKLENIVDSDESPKLRGLLIEADIESVKDVLVNECIKYMCAILEINAVFLGSDKNEGKRGLKCWKFENSVVMSRVNKMY